MKREKVYLEARIDELTGLLNRKYFYEILEQETEKHKNSSLSLILLSVDDFKLYNQFYGTQEGDLALQQVATALRGCVVKTDMWPVTAGRNLPLSYPSMICWQPKRRYNSPPSYGD